MQFAIEVLFKIKQTHISRNAIKSACRYDINPLFLSKFVVIELHFLHEIWLATNIDVVSAGIDTKGQNIHKCIKHGTKTITCGTYHALTTGSP